MFNCALTGLTLESVTEAKLNVPFAPVGVLVQHVNEIFAGYGLIGVSVT